MSDPTVTKLEPLVIHGPPNDRVAVTKIEVIVVHDLNALAPGAPSTRRQAHVQVRYGAAT